MVKQGIYQHYKGNYYAVLGECRHSETVEEMIVYMALYETEEFGKNTIWVRPKKMFEETITFDGKEVPRFKFIK